MVAQHNGLPIRVEDIATVRMGALTRYGAVSMNGNGEAVTAVVLALRGANARQTIEHIENKLSELQASLPSGIHIKVFYNRGILVGQAVHTVSKALMEAIVLVVVLLILFLGDFIRAALTVALALPMAALGTFILMNAFGMSANLMSLGGLSIAIGMLVDGAVVVVENVITQLSDQRKVEKLPRLH